MNQIISWCMFRPPHRGYSANTFDDADGANMISLPCTSSNASDVGRNVYMGRIQLTSSPQFYILYCHGNAEDVLLLQPFLAHLSRAFDAVVYAVEYSGYGPTRCVPNRYTGDRVNLSLLLPHPAHARTNARPHTPGPLEGIRVRHVCSTHTMTCCRRQSTSLSERLSLASCGVGRWGVRPPCGPRPSMEGVSR